MFVCTYFDISATHSRACTHKHSLSAPALRRGGYSTIIFKSRVCSCVQQTGAATRESLRRDRPGWQWANRTHACGVEFCMVFMAIVSGELSFICLDCLWIKHLFVVCFPQYGSAFSAIVGILFACLREGDTQLSWALFPGALFVVLGSHHLISPSLSELLGSHGNSNTGFLASFGLWTSGPAAGMWTIIVLSSNMCCCIGNDVVVILC